MTTMMAMPTVSPAHRRLERLAGAWLGEERLYPSTFAPQGGAAVGRVSTRSALDGFAVIQDYQQERDGRVSYRGHGLFRWDEAARSYVLHWFDSMGLPPSEFRGTFEGDVLTLTNTGPQGAMRAAFELGDDRYTYRMQVSPDGKDWFPFMEGTYTRQG